MVRDEMLPRALLTYALIVPVVILLGYLLAEPFSQSSVAFVGLLLGLLAVPLLLKYYEVLLVTTWNVYLNVFFLPGQPPWWMLLTAIGLLFLVVNRTMRRQPDSRIEWSVGLPLVVFTVVAVGTALVTGGVGLRVLGSDVFGGRKLITLMCGIAAFFVLSRVHIPPERIRLYVGLFFVSGVTAMGSNLVFLSGERFYWLFYLFPTERSLHLFLGEASWGQTITRFGGIGTAGASIVFWLLAIYGIRRILSLERWWLAPLLLLGLGLSLMGGFRSTVLLMAMLFTAQFILEGLHRTRLVVAVVVAFLLAGVLLVAFSTRLPLAAQRAISVLPVSVDATVERDADVSTHWRIDMWRAVLPDVPRYLWIGKGFAINPTDLHLAQESMRRGLAQQYEHAVVAGDYHNGVLTLIIPFGIFGLLSFCWFAAAALRLAYRNYHDADPAFKSMNAFLFAMLASRLVFYFAIYGQIDSNMVLFTGLVGLSIAVNRSLHQGRVGEWNARQSPVNGAAESGR